MTWVTYLEVNELTNITSSDVANASITSLIGYARRQLLSDIQIRAIREKVRYIDNTRQNLINGSNTSFYVQNWKGSYLGDLDLDGDVDTSDVTVYQVTSGGTETTLTVSAVDQDDCKITLSTAPASGVILYITYCYAPVDVSTPNALVNLACAYLTASYCYAKVNIGKARSVSYGNTRILRDMESSNEYYTKYRSVLKQICDFAPVNMGQSENIL